MPDVKNPEFDLLIKIVTVYPDMDNIQNLIIDINPQSLDWSYLVELAYYHGLTPLLYMALINIDNELMPADTIENIKAFVMGNTQQNLFLYAELLKLIQIFLENNIEIIPFKGPMLSSYLYNSHLIRQAGDIDFLVKPKDVILVVQILQQRGFSSYYPLSRSQEIALVKVSTANHIVLIHKVTGLMVEVHWQFYTNDFFRKSETKHLWDFLEEVSEKNVKILDFKPEIKFLLLCFHGYKHNWFRLFLIWEVSRLLIKETDLDWDMVIANSEKLGGQGVLLISLNVIKRFFEIPLPDQIEELIDQDKVSRRLADQLVIEPERFNLEANSDYSLLDVKNRFLVREKFYERVGRFLQFVFTPNYFDIVIIDFPKPFHFLYFVIRPFRILVKNIGEVFQ